MRSCVLDLETYLITAQDQAPKIVCGQVGTCEEGRRRVYLREDLRPVLDKILDGSWEVWGHNVSFDLACLIKTWPDLTELIWQRLIEGKILDTMIASKLRANEAGTLQRLDKPGVRAFSMLGCVEREFDADLSADKSEDSWRLRYSELDGVPVKDWPTDALRYALDDVYWTHKLALRYGHPPDLAAKTCAQFALYLTTVEGIHVDAAVVERLRSEFSESMVRLEAALVESKVLRWNKDRWSKDMGRIKALVQSAWPDGDWPLTDTGINKRRELLKSGEWFDWSEDERCAFCEKYTSTNGDTCQQSGVQELLDLDEYKGVEKILTSYLTKLDKGKDHPLRVSYSVPKATGRTSAWGDIGIQQLPRKYDIRRAIIPSAPGGTLIGCDYDSLELRCWAQVCLDLLGESVLADKYRQDPGFDPHSYFAAYLLGITYEEGIRRKKSGDPEFAQARQLAKAPNFGYIGGMGAATLVAYARAGYGVIITLERAQELKDAFFSVWPQARPYLDHISNRVIGRNRDRGQLEQIRSGRLRGDVTFCAAANGFFQGLAADGALAAVVEVQRRCYADKSSALYGSKMLAFIHDEIIVDTPRERAHDAAMEVQSIMIASMARFVPDVPIRCEPVLMDRWLKGAKPMFDDQGRLVPCT
jgi:hypothetical protein